MGSIEFGRREFSFVEGKTVLTSTTVTERALRNEDEQTFTKRLMEKYRDKQGKMQIVFKAGRPDYALITIADRQVQP